MQCYNRTNEVTIFHKRCGMILYELCAQQSCDDAAGQYTTYGIAVSDGGRIIRVIGDISLEREKVASLVGRFNRERLCPAHLDEMIENFLYDFEV